MSVSISSLGSSRWLTKEELEALIVETISPHDVRIVSFLSTSSSSPRLSHRFKIMKGSFPLSFVYMTLVCCLLQYNRFIQLMDRLLSMPYCATEEEFVLRYRRQLEAQTRKEMVPTLERDDRGVAFSTSDGRYAHLASCV